MAKVAIYTVELLFEQRLDATNVLYLMHRLMDRYGYATLSDLYELVGLQINYNDVRVGWNEKDVADIVESNNGWVLRLPPPRPVSELV